MDPAEAPAETALRPRWATHRLKDVCLKIGSGATPRGGANAYPASGPYTLIRSQNVRDQGFRRGGLAFIDDDQAGQLKGVEVRDGDVLLNITGDSVARCCLVIPDVLPARVNQHVAIVRPDPKLLDNVFLRYWLISPAVKQRLLSWAGMGATRNALTKAMIEGLEVTAPRNVDEQRQIAGVLGSIEGKIDADLAAAAAAEEFARAVVLADASSAPRVTIGSLARASRDIVDPATLGDMAVDHYSIPALDAGAPEQVPASEIMSAKLVLPGSCVVVSRLNPTIPRIWLITHEGIPPALASTEFAVLTPRSISSEALYAACSHPEFSVRLASKVTGTSSSHQRIHLDDVLATEVLDPLALSDARLALVNEAVAYADELRRGVRALRSSLEALLPQLIDGSLPVWTGETER